MDQEARSRPGGAAAVEVICYPEAIPTFILGSVRSGTSAVMHALREGAGIRGFNEGVFAHLMPVLLSAVDTHYRTFIRKPTTMLGSVPRGFLEAGIKNLFGRAYIETMGAGRWLDKTPGGPQMVNACPALLEIFPAAKFIFCRRRGIENILSRQRKYPDHAFELHCNGWAKTMEAWIAVKPALAGCAVEVDQRDMAIRPEAVADTVCALLGLSPTESEGFLRVLRDHRIEQTRPAQDETPISLSETGWSLEEQETFRRICGPMMQAFGYGTGDERPARRSAGYRFFVPVAKGLAEGENVALSDGCRALDARRFSIVPNRYGEPAAGIRYKMIELDRVRRFSARLSVSGPEADAAEGVVFEFKLEHSGDRAPVFSAEHVVRAGNSAEWRCDLPTLSGAFDAILSVRPLSEPRAAAPIAAEWMDAELT
jgi:hypothetical protein